MVLPRLKWCKIAFLTLTYLQNVAPTKTNKILKFCDNEDRKSCSSQLASYVDSHMNSLEPKLKHRYLESLFGLTGSAIASKDVLEDLFKSLTEDEKVLIIKFALGRFQLSDEISKGISHSSGNKVQLNPKSFPVYPWEEQNPSEHDSYRKIIGDSNTKPEHFNDLYTEAHLIEGIPADMCIGFEDRCVKLVHIFLDSLPDNDKDLAIRSMVGDYENAPPDFISSVFNSIKHQHKLALLKISWDRDELSRLITQKILPFYEHLDSSKETRTQRNLPTSFETPLGHELLSHLPDLALHTAPVDLTASDLGQDAEVVMNFVGMLRGSQRAVHSPFTYLVLFSACISLLVMVSTRSLRRRSFYTQLA